MASTAYVYSITNDFPGSVLRHADRLQNEIKASSITTPISYINTSGDEVSIWFADALTSGEKTTLDGDTIHPAGGLIAAHQDKPYPPPTEFDAIVSPGGEWLYTTVGQALADGCKAIYVKNGTYVESSDLVLPGTGAVSIYGESPGGVTIVLLGSAKMTLDGNGGVVESTGTVSLTNGSTTVTGSGTTFTNISPEWWLCVGGVFLHIASIQSDTSMTLKAPYQGRAFSNTTFKAMPMAAGALLSNLMLYKTTGGTGTCLYLRAVNHGVVRDCLISGKTTSGYGVHVDSCTETFLISTVVQRVGSDAFYVQNSTLIELSACACKQNVGHGLEFNASDNCVMDQCIFVSNGGGGVSVVNGSTRISLTDSIIHRNGGRGIQTSSDSSVCVMDSCEITENGSHGIDFDGADNIVASCVLRNNAGKGIAAGDNGAISNCQIDNNTGIGIDLANDKRCAVSGNRVISNGDVGINIGTTGSDNTIMGNVLKSNGAEGIKCAGDRCVIQGNRCVDNTAEGIEITADAEKCVVVGNIVTGSGGTIVDSGSGTELGHNITS